MKIIKQIIDKYIKNNDPVKYWRKKGAKIGKNCEIYPSVSLGSEPYLISIGDHVRINSKVELITHDGGVWVFRGNKSIVNSEEIDLFGMIKIGNNTHIGTNVIIMPGVTIGNNCVIGCGAVVTKNIPDNSVAVGVPAKVIETIEEYLYKNKNKFDYTKKMDADEKKKYLLKKYYNINI